MAGQEENQDHGSNRMEQLMEALTRDMERRNRMEQRMEALTRDLERVTRVLNGLQINDPAPPTQRGGPIPQRAVPILPRRVENRREEGATRPSPEFDEEEDVELEQQFQPRSRRNYPSNNSYKIKADLPTFNGAVDIEQFLDWIYEVE